MKHIPNIVSLSRIGISIILLIPSTTVFIIGYIVAGLNDVLDGYIARKYHLESNVGAKLDSLGDVVFWIVVLYMFIKQLSSQITIVIICIMGLVVLLRVINVIFTKIKFNQIGMIHSIGNKISGFVLYAVIPYCMVINQIPDYIVIFVSIITIVSSIDEMWMLHKLEVYNSNQKSSLAL